MPKKSYDTVKIKSLDRAKVLNSLKKIARLILKKNPNVEEISLFGSVARGNYTGTSDADILIVLKKDNRRFIDRISPYLESFLHAGIAVDVFPYTKKEIEQMGAVNSLVKKIQDEKIVLVKRS